MVEVFKTNVKDQDHAKLLIDQIHHSLVDYTANFDLDDCDNILRVKCVNGFVQTSLVIDLLKNLGYEAEILPDEINLVER